MILRTARLVLRPWQDADRASFAALSAEPHMRQFLRPLDTRAESDAWIDRQIAHQMSHGFCLWAAEDRASGALAGAVGLSVLPAELPLPPGVEAGWRIASAFCGRGYATEAAREALRFGFDEANLPEIVARAAVANGGSRHVMTKLGMTKAQPLEDPRRSAEDPTRHQVLYRLACEDWRRTVA